MYFFLIDHDDVLLPDCISVLLDKALKEKADIVYSDEYLLLERFHRMRRTKKGEFLMSNLEKENFINHPILINKCIWDQVEGMREGFEGSQDFDLYLRMAEITSRIAYVPQALYIWRVNQGSFSVKHFEACVEARERALKNHFERINN